MIKLFVGDITSELAVQALQEYPSAQLLTQNNYKNISDGIYYTSLGDFKYFESFIQVLYSADEIIYINHSSWSSETLKKATAVGLCKVYKKIIQGREQLVPDVSRILHLADKRQSDGAQIWIAGCSISAGVGVVKESRYGQLISNKLNLPVSFLSQGGAAIEWAGDQILRSDIKKDDILIWGLTSENRMPYFDGTSLHHVNTGYYSIFPDFKNIIPPERLLDPDLVYKSIIHIHEVLNFCKKIGVKVVLAGLLISDEFIQYLMDLDCYVDLCLGQEFLDIGYDSSHPGPKTHIWYAEQILNHIQHNGN